MRTRQSVSCCLTSITNRRRQSIDSLWEVSLNLHWIAVDPLTRAQDFSNFTVMELRKLFQQSGNEDQVAAFDKMTDRFQSRFWYKDARGRNRAHSCFATTTVYNRTAELEDPWATEYQSVLTAYIHACTRCPCAIMHCVFQQHYGDSEAREQNSVRLIAVHAIDVIVRDVQLLTRMNVIQDFARVSELYHSFQDTIAQIAKDDGVADSRRWKCPIVARRSDVDSQGSHT